MTIPLWMPLALAGATTFYFARIARRFRPGQCSGCGYDLTAISPHAACPECGRSQSA